MIRSMSRLYITFIEVAILILPDVSTDLESHNRSVDDGILLGDSGTDALDIC